MEGKGYTQDGTVDLRGQPVRANKTGKWKACAFLVGMHLHYYNKFSLVNFAEVVLGLVVYNLHGHHISQNDSSSFFWDFP